jgi:hypothetical protein
MVQISVYHLHFDLGGIYYSSFLVGMWIDVRPVWYGVQVMTRLIDAYV